MIFHRTRISVLSLPAFEFGVVRSREERLSAAGVAIQRFFAWFDVS